MARYHINPEGQATMCNAKPGNCPFAEDSEHFDTIEEAQQRADVINQYHNNPIEGRVENLKEDIITKSGFSILNYGDTQEICYKKDVIAYIDTATNNMVIKEDTIKQTQRDTLTRLTNRHSIKRMVEAKVPFKYYDTNNIKTEVAKREENADSMYLALSGDESATSEVIWKNGDYIPEYKDSIENNIDKLEISDVSGSSWATPILIVHNKDNSIEKVKVDRTEMATAVVEENYKETYGKNPFKTHSIKQRPINSIEDLRIGGKIKMYEESFDGIVDRDGEIVEIYDDHAIALIDGERHWVDEDTKDIFFDID